MDKRGSCIVVGCIVSTTLVSLLFICAFQFSHNCELIFIEPAQIQSQAVANWHQVKARRASDKSMLMKLSAVIEYNLPRISENLENLPTIVTQPSPPNANATTTTTPATTTSANGALSAGSSQVQSGTSGQMTSHNQVLASPQAAAQYSSPPAALSSTQQPPISNQNNTNYNNNNKHSPQPSSPQQLDLNPQQTSSNNNSQSTAAQQPPRQRRPQLKDRRFLPVSSQRLEMKRRSSSNQTVEYQLHLNCSSLRLWFVRRGTDSVQLERATLELKPEGPHKVSSCELQLPANATNYFDLDLRPREQYGQPPHSARFQCTEPLKLPCLNRKQSSGSVDADSSTGGDLIATLHIHAIDYEIARLAEMNVGQTFNSLVNMKKCPSTASQKASIQVQPGNLNASGNFSGNGQQQQQPAHRMVKRGAFGDAVKGPLDFLKKVRSKLTEWRKKVKKNLKLDGKNIKKN